MTYSKAAITVLVAGSIMIAFALKSWEREAEADIARFNATGNWLSQIQK